MYLVGSLQTAAQLLPIKIKEKIRLAGMLLLDNLLYVSLRLFEE